MQAERARAQAELCAAAQAFRLAREAEGADALVRALDALVACFASLPAARGAPLAAALELALAAQARGDWIALADELEHVLAPALAGE